jgi:ribonuclease HII
MSAEAWQLALADAGEGACVVGVDEVGRGPLAGDVVAAAVVLDPERPIEGLADSKALTERRREGLAAQIRESAGAFALGRASAQEIDEINILQASLLAMRRAVAGLQLVPDLVLVDGNRLPQWSWRALAVIKGDARVAQIGAASILAKVTRDREMLDLDRQWPLYGFARHKGYPTAEHLAALREHGPCPAHRRSFGPVRSVLENPEERKPHV